MQSGLRSTQWTLFQEPACAAHRMATEARVASDMASEAAAGAHVAAAELRAEVTSLTRRVAAAREACTLPPVGNGVLQAGTATRARRSQPRRLPGLCHSASLDEVRRKLQL